MELEAKSTDPNDPSVEIRTDLWNELTLAQLTRQRELMLDRINTLQRIPDQGNPTVQSLYSAMQLGLQDLTKLIDYKMSLQPHRRIL